MIRSLPRRTRPGPAPEAVRRMTAAAAALLLLATALALAAVRATPARATTVPPPPPGWSTVWSDAFAGSAGSAPSSANWLYDTGTSYPGGAANWGTGEVESNTSSTANVHLDGNGHLVITPVKSGSIWTSGRIETQRTDFAAPAGGELEVSASIQQPNPSSGLGYWPAFWMLGSAFRGNYNNWPGIGEIDVMEDVNALSEHSGTLHCGTDPGGPCNETNGIGSGLQACSGCQTGYHTYSVIVDRTNTSAEQIRWYLDGSQYFSVSESQVGTSTWQAAVDHGFFLILDLAIGGGYPNGVCGCATPTASTTSGAGMSIGYVAVYQTTSGGSGGGGGGGGGASCATAATADIAADCYNSSQGAITVSPATGDTNPSGVDGNQAAQLVNGDYLEYGNINFGSGSSQFDARVASGAAGGVSGLVEVVLDNPANSPVGSFAVASTGGWSSWRTIPANITTTTGTHNVYLKFVSGASGSPPFVSLHYFDFPAS